MQTGENCNLKTTLGRLALAVAAVLLFAGAASAQSADHWHHIDYTNADRATPNASMSHEAQDWAKQALAKSPRHQEWVKIKYKPAGSAAEREINAFVVFLEVKKKVAAVIAIHEINGLTDWVQSLTDQVAEAGYVAIAPDLLSVWDRVEEGRALLQTETQSDRQSGICLLTRSLPT